MPDTKSIIKARIKSLYNAMGEKELDALIVNHDDEYLSSAIGDDAKRLEYISGFTGSAGTAVILKNPRDKHDTITGRESTDQYSDLKNCALFIDGRYGVQAKQQIDPELFSVFNMRDVNECDYLCATLPRNSKVGIDLNTVSFKFFKETKSALSNFDIDLIGVDGSPVDLIWLDRPKATYSQILIYPDEYSGCPSLVKRQNLAKELIKRNLDATIISRPETICWLLNIRGSDKKYLPVVNSRLVAFSNDRLEWYVDDSHFTSDILDKLADHFGHVDIFPPEQFSGVLERLNNSKSWVYVDPEATNAKILNALNSGGSTVVEGLGICEQPKAVKNSLEIASEQKANLKYSVALCRFLAWLDDLTKASKKITNIESFKKRVGEVTEETLAERLESFRKIEGEYYGPSFGTISAIGSNAAMPHYSHLDSAKPKSLGEDPLYLFDSGAQYIEGTTDVTRTVLVGPHATEEIKRMFTLVLKAHISLANTIFPKGTSGLQLDAIARRPMWDHGLDYLHGTGHGVGHMLSVHEGPQAISTKTSTVPLEAGMVMSIEPGYYKENEYGIRLENLVVVEKCSKQGCKHMLCFAPLTLVPFDLRLILREMLTKEERDWLNNYHANVNSIITRSASTLSDFEIEWLNQATKAI